MSKYVLKIRPIDKRVFDAIQSGLKDVETRAAIEEYRKIKEKDFIVFDCEGDKIEKEVNKVKLYKDINEILKEIDFKRIMPFVDSREEATNVWHSFPNYKEKIEENGLIAFWFK